jgi:hypothetical protein
MTIIQCLRQEVVSGANTYPIFVGFSPASQILSLAAAPSFSPQTPHSDICTNIQTTPVRDWQRPLNGTRVDEIATVYNDTGELMPNPVLLCENAFLSGSVITIRQQVGTGGVPTNIWEIDVRDPSQGAQKPLWILDGQHRINGLSQSRQSNNAIPVVLLLNQTQQIYQGPLVAKLFAQVTTAASPLDELHNEWLTFAFRLKEFDPNSQNGPENVRAMETVVELCRRPFILNGSRSNPFHNKVRFNMHDSNVYGPLPGGFRYNCKDLKELVSKYYYLCSAGYGQHLSPVDLADQMALAFEALTMNVVHPHSETVFFGIGSFEQRIMQDAFWVGVFAAILKGGPKPDWNPLLQSLAFPTASWKFDWTVSLNGTAGTISKKLAIDVFSTAFEQGALPTTSGNLVDYLKGNNAAVELQFSNLSSNARPTRSGRSQLRVVAGNTLSQTISPAKHFKISKKSGNIGKLEIINNQSPPGSPVLYKEKGEILSVTAHNNPLRLSLKMYHYGGKTGVAQVDISW